MAKEIFCKLKIIFLPCRDNKYKPRFLDSKFLFYYALFLLFLKLIVLPFLFYFPKTAFFADVTKTNLIEYTNSTRAHFGLTTLRENPTLNRAAYLKAQDMLSRGYFAHYSPEGVSPWYWLIESGYNYRVAGENLAIGFLESEQVHQAWMNSYSHKENILNPNYREIGIAVVKGNFQGNETTLVVQFLGAPRIEFIQEEAIQAVDQPPIQPKPIDEKIKTEPSETEEIEIAEEVAAEEEVAEEEEVMDKKIEEETKEEYPILVVEQREIEKTPLFLLFNFMTSDYYNWIQRIIYGSLVLIIISLLITIYCDIFIYRKFVFDHKDILFKTIAYSALWFVLLFLDKMIMVELITYNFRIN